MKVLEPQLAVVKGLVTERTQQLGMSVPPGQQVFGTRRCRHSYSIIVREPYNPEKHKGLPIQMNPNSGVQYVDNIIDWFIRRGEEFSVDTGISRPHSATLPYKETLLRRNGRIVMSTLPAEQLPLRTTTNACTEVVTVSYTLTHADMKLKNRQLWKLQKKYWRAEFKSVVKPGPAELSFQIVGKDGVLSSSRTSLVVELKALPPTEVRRPPMAASPIGSNGAMRQTSFGTAPTSPAASAGETMRQTSYGNGTVSTSPAESPGGAMRQKSFGFGTVASAATSPGAMSQTSFGALPTSARENGGQYWYM